MRVDILERLADLIRPGAGLAREFVRRKAGRRVRRPRLCGDAGDDVADRIGRRGFCLGPARARLSHGPQAAIAAEAGGSGGDGVCRKRRRSKAPATRWRPPAIPRHRPRCCRWSGSPPNDNAPRAAAAPEPEAVAEAPVAETPASLKPLSLKRPWLQSLLRKRRPRHRGRSASRSRREAETAPAAAEAAPRRSRRRVEAAAAPDAGGYRREAAAAPEAPAEPELVEVWRPGGRSEERRPRHDRNRHHRHQPAGRRARRSSPLKAPAKAARAPNRSGIAAGATATAISKSRAKVRRLKGAAAVAAEGAPAPARETARGQGFSPRSSRGQGPRSATDAATNSAATARAATATRASATAAASSAARAAATSATAGRRTGNTPPAPRLARPRPSGRSQFALCKARGAQGAARAQGLGISGLHPSRRALCALLRMRIR